MDIEKMQEIRNKGYLFIVALLAALGLFGLVTPEQTTGVLAAVEKLFGLLAAILAYWYSRPRAYSVSKHSAGTSGP